MIRVFNVICEYKTHRTATTGFPAVPRQRWKGSICLKHLTGVDRRSLLQLREIRPPVEGRDLNTFNEERGSQAGRLRP